MYFRILVTLAGNESRLTEHGWFLLYLVLDPNVGNKEIQFNNYKM